MLSKAPRRSFLSKVPSLLMSINLKQSLYIWTCSHQLIELTLRHEDTNVVKSSTEIIFVQSTVLVDVHQLEAVLVHLDLLLREASFILSLAHDEMRVLFC